MVAPVRMMLNRADVPYNYINIHQDDAARERVREINGGHEGVPLVAFPDGHTLTEPPMQELRDHLAAAGYTVGSSTVFLAQLWNFRFVIIPLLLLGVLMLLEQL